jgi:hypothetical protein
MHKTLKLYRNVYPIVPSVVCSVCGQPVNRGAGKSDQSATLPASMYACDCAYFSSTQLILPLTQSEWDRNVKRSATGVPATDEGPSTIEVSPEAKSPDPIEAPQPASTLVLYDGMRLAIARCAEVDEAAGIKNKAAQLEAYARVRDDAESQRRFAEIRLRACVRIGELSRELETAQGLRPNGRTKSKEDTLQEAGLAKSTALDYEQLAGGKDKQAQNVASAATEAYFAAQQTNGGEVSMGGLKVAVKEAVVAALGPPPVRPRTPRSRRSRRRGKPQELSPEDQSNRKWATWMKGVDQLEPELAADGEYQEFAQEELDRSERAVAVIRRYQSQMSRKFHVTTPSI